MQCCTATITLPPGTCRKLDPPTDPPDTTGDAAPRSSPSRARVEASLMVSALSNPARPHRPYPEPPDPHPLPPKRPRSSSAASPPRDASHGGGGGGGVASTTASVRSDHQMATHSIIIKQEPVATTSGTNLIIKQEPGHGGGGGGGGGVTSFVNVTEASAVPWAPVLLETKAEMKTQRSGTTYSSSSGTPALSHDTFSGNLELDTGRNTNVNVFSPSPRAPSEGMYAPLSCTALMLACSSLAVHFRLILRH